MYGMLTTCQAPDALHIFSFRYLFIMIFMIIVYFLSLSISSTQVLGEAKLFYSFYVQNSAWQTGAQ